MLSDAQIEHYRTFGFVALPAFLGNVTQALADEVNAAITDAYQATYDQRDTEGISGHYLPMASRYTPLSASLICDDPRFIRAAEALLGGPVIPECPEGVLYFFDAGWHNDDGIGVIVRTNLRRAERRMPRPLTRAFVVVGRDGFEPP